MKVAKIKASDKNIEKIIEIKNVTKKFGDVTVVDDMNLSIRKGEFITLLGPSGCGKTTLLRMIAGFEMPTSGQIFINKEECTFVAPNKRNVNTVFQKYALFPHLNVFNNIAFGLKMKQIQSGEKTNRRGIVEPIYRKFNKAEIQEKVNNALKMVGLDDYGHRDVGSLSGGQQQRVAIARALVCEPQVLLLDEPLGALDLKMRKEMQIELMSMHKNLGITFVYVTHDQEEALTMSDKIAVMKDGVIQQIGTPKSIYDEPVNAFVADFIGESNILGGVMIADYRVNINGVVFDCEDKGYAPNERVDLVIRPEDIYVMERDNAKGMLDGEVVSSVFKGTYYEMNIRANDYEYTVQDTTYREIGALVRLYVKPFDIHIMKKQRTTNTFITEMTSDTTVEICGAAFEIEGTEFEKGDKVVATIAFDKIILTDDEDDGTIGGNIAQSLYKGSYYQVQVYTDDDQDFYLDTKEDWDIDDRVGIMINAADIILTKYVEEEEDDNNGETAQTEV